MFRDDMQRSQVCKAILSGVRRSDWWRWGTTPNDVGPTDEALELIEADGGPLSSGERVMLLFAADVWSGLDKCKVGQMLAKLDGSNLRIAGEFFCAMSEGARGLDRFIERFEPRQ
jgi:hypothetical protein